MICFLKLRISDINFAVLAPIFGLSLLLARPLNGLWFVTVDFQYSDIVTRGVEASAQ